VRQLVALLALLALGGCAIVLALLVRFLFDFYHTWLGDDRRRYGSDRWASELDPFDGFRLYKGIARTLHLCQRFRIVRDTKTIL